MASTYPVHLVLVGPPGAGKGTQAAQLESQFGLKQISSGDLFRENLKNQTELGELARTYIDRGELVPDNVTIAMVEDRIQRPDCAKGVIFDGFPRTLEQASALDEMLALQDSEIQLAPALVVSDDVIIDRMTGRRVCRNCGAVYHMCYNPPKAEGVCDICGGELYQRSDDLPETVRNRLFVYYKQTSPLIGYYYAKGLLVRVNADQPIGAVSREMVAAVRTVIDK
ncbi:MAG: adenylate kinase [Anaerolineae bacterium]|nr:adenylate kinase [Anaerolineae bacterium]MCB9132798.1 adenylate kinase [Anaerolineales bacterium]MCB0227614.1 adenylate kinase [Anaerolineae bacterium]MCB0232733.1 adenylate kinase [Anaerolineae bacterium]MCB0238282.1 adenylate kinase [Anaerolineae bacterium]